MIILAFLVVLFFFGGLVLRKYLVTEPLQQPVAETESAPRELRDVTLYFTSADGTHLVAEGRQIDDCLEENDCLEETVQALINGPVEELVPVFPNHVVLRGVTVTEGVVQVDFSRDLVTGHPGGSAAEVATLTSILRTVALNFPGTRSCVILVEGAQVETLAGNLDMVRPFDPRRWL